MQLETRNKIKSFEQIGWCEPEETKAGKPMKWLRSLTHDNYLFDQEAFNPDISPNVIFVPEEPLWNKIIEAVAKHPENTDQLLIKFCDFLPPKPQWMIDQDEKKAALRAQQEEMFEEEPSSGRNILYDSTSTINVIAL